MKSTDRPLTGKQEAFVSAYLGASNYNATHAARLAGYRGNGNGLATVGAQNMRKLHVRREITRRQAALQEQSKVTPEYVLGKLLTLAESTERDSDQMRALELIGKHLGMFVDKTVHQVGQFRIEVVRLEDPRAPVTEGEPGVVLEMLPGPDDEA
jgi:hypothetical protein